MMENILNSKEIKKYILDSSSDLEKVISYLEEDYPSTIEGIFNAIFTLMRHYDQNRSRVDYLLNLVEGSISLVSGTEIKFLSGSIIDLNHKISNWKLKDQIKVREVLVRIQEILFSADQQAMNQVKNKKVKYLSYLVFEEKNVALIERFLQDSDGLLASRDKDGDNFFGVLLKRYIYLDESHVEEIEYFYHIILLFMNSKYRHQLMQEKDYYVGIIQKSKLSLKMHVIRLIELFDPNFSITLDQLEERYRVSFSFLPSILEEVKSFSVNGDDRTDFRYQDCVTIDGESALCLDDAIYLEENFDGTYYLYVHITDIPSIVPFGSITDLEAKKRVETLYLRGCKIPLYPVSVCDDICSLQPYVERNVISYIFHLDSCYQVMEDDFRFVRGRICVRHGLTYQGADDVILGEENTSLAVMLRKLACFAEVRKKGNVVRKQYREYQNVFVADPNHESLRADVSPSSNIVHEAMVLVNYRIAKYFKDIELPYLYRAIDLPSDAFIREQLEKLRGVSPDFLSEREAYQRIRDGYTNGKYVACPTYHRGQNVSCYSHSSSPGRRYSDGFNQYLIYDFCFYRNLSEANIYRFEYQVNELAYYLNKSRKENEVFSNHYNYLASKNLIKK